MATEERMLYTTKADSTLTGPEEVLVSSGPGRDLTVTAPPALGGAEDRQEWNPEQLYAAALASCMHQALLLTAQVRGVDCGGSRVTAEVSLEHDGSLHYSFDAALSVELPQIEPAVRAEVIAEAVRACPLAEGVRITGG